MKLLLASQGFLTDVIANEVARVVEKKLSEINIAIVNESYLELDREKDKRWVIRELGCLEKYIGGRIDFIDFKRLSKEEISERIEQADLIYFMGGKRNVLARIIREYDLKDIIDDIKLVPCHNDTVSENFIKNKENKMYLIDWEYAGMNDPMWDLAAYCLENNFTENEEELFLKIYFRGNIEDKYKKRILINKIYQDFLWSIWTTIKEANGEKFGDYGISRYNRAKINLEKVFELIV